MVAGRHSRDDGELGILVLGILEAFLKVAPWIQLIQQGDGLHFIDVKDGFTPGTVIDFLDDAGLLVGTGKAAVACLLTDEARDAFTVLAQDNDTDGKAPVLHILCHAPEVGRQRILQCPFVHIVGHLLGGFLCVILQARAIAHLRVPHQAGRDRLVALDKVHDVIGHGVVHTPRHIIFVVAKRLGIDVLFTEHAAAVHVQKSSLSLHPGDVVDARHHESLISSILAHR